VRQIPFEQFPANEIADFQAACARYRVSPDSFQVSAEEGYSLTDPIQPIRRAIAVVNKATLKAHRYPGGVGSRWVNQFAIDLDAGAFS
jgi:hypothetical protein